MEGMTENPLTRAETELYDTLFNHRNTVVPTDDLGAVLDTIRKPGQERNTWNAGNLVAVHIRNLRKKIPTTQSIETVRGVGYRLVA